MKQFSKYHLWVDQDKEETVIGLSDYAKEQLGNIMFVNLPEVGEEIRIGNKFGDVESIKTVSDLIAPVDGIVMEINEEAVDDPEMLNDETRESWLIKVKTDKANDALMSAEEYDRVKEKL